MMPRPKTTPWIPGITCPSLAWRASATGIRIDEPITGPHRVPTPPNSVTTRAWAEVSMPNTVGGVTTSSTTA